MPPTPSTADILSQVADLAEDLSRLATAVDELNGAVRTYRIETAPVLEEYRAAEQARREARARADAERLEGRGKVEQMLTSKAAYAVYAAALSWLGAWLTGIVGSGQP